MVQDIYYIKIANPAIGYFDLRHIFGELLYCILNTFFKWLTQLILLLFLLLGHAKMFSTNSAVMNQTEFGNLLPVCQGFIGRILSGMRLKLRQARRFMLSSSRLKTLLLLHFSVHGVVGFLQGLDTEASFLVISKIDIR